jgi:hypothetical protein
MWTSIVIVVTYRIFHSLHLLDGYREILYSLGPACIWVSAGVRITNVVYRSVAFSQEAQKMNKSTINWFVPYLIY